jgi:pyruvate ferredoxin oxidoreductase delta subunit
MQKQPGKPINKSENCRLYGPVAVVFNSVDTGSWRTRRPAIDYSDCSNCGNCRMYCPCDVIAINDYDEQGQYFKVNWDYCKGCGICANVCPKHCITMVDEEAGETHETNVGW